MLIRVRYWILRRFFRWELENLANYAWRMGYWKGADDITNFVKALRR